MEGGVRFLEFTNSDGRRVMIALEHITKILEIKAFSNETKNATIIYTVDRRDEILEMGYDEVKRILKYSEER